MSDVILPSAPDADILGRLVRARQFLEHAKSHAACGTDFDYMIATHGADNAIEFTLKLIADHVRYEEISGSTLPETELAQIAGVLFRFLRDTHRITLPHFQDIKALRRIRNLVQHGSFTPGSDIDRQISIADRFFSNVCTSIFGLDASQLRIASIVTDSAIRRHLVAAEDALQARQFEDCVRACRNALEEALFRYRKDSPMALAEIPARVALAKLGPEAERYVVLLSEELDSLRLKMDANHLQRFRYIAKHLPAEPDCDPYGHLVLQRGWEKADAEYCYGFVSGNILRWQSGELAPLYTPTSSDRHRHDESINDIPLLDDEAGCVYLEDNHAIHLIYAPRTLRDQLEDLETEKVYRWFSKHYRNDVLETEISSQVQLRFVRSELVTHDPVRWKVVLDVSREPLTWHRRDLVDGEITKETPSLQNCTEEDLVSLYPVDADAAQRVLAAREQHGLLNAELLRQVEGLSSLQLEWIESFMRM